MRYLSLLLGIFVLWSCSGSPTSTTLASTDYIISMAGVGSFDSVVTAYSSNGQDTTYKTFLPSDLDSSGNLSLSISASKNAKVSVQSIVWKNGKVLATQSSTVSSGGKAQSATTILTPIVAISAPAICYLDLTTCRVVAKAKSRSVTASTEIKQISLDINGDGVFDTSMSGGTLGTDSLLLSLKTLSGMAAGQTQTIILKATEVSGRTFYDTASVKVLASASLFTDIRDGNAYPYRQIGAQVWMTQNLRYVPEGLYDSSWCYANDTANCMRYGRLYDWPTAMEGSTSAGATGICPTGWHVPTASEIGHLASYADSADDLQIDYTSGTSLKADTSWKSGAGMDLFGFDGLASGYYANSQFYSLGTYAMFWTSNISEPPWAIVKILASTSATATTESHSLKDGYSVRCIQDTK